MQNKFCHMNDKFQIPCVYKPKVCMEENGERYLPTIGIFLC